MVLTVCGQGFRPRAFCYVDDLIDGLFKFMNSDDSVTGPINLGNPEEIAIRELAEIIIELTGSSSTIVSEPLPVNDPRRRCPDTSRAQAILRWSPAVTLEKVFKRPSLILIKFCAKGLPAPYSLIILRCVAPDRWRRERYLQPGHRYPHAD